MDDGGTAWDPGASVMDLIAGAEPPGTCGGVGLPPPPVDLAASRARMEQVLTDSTILTEAQRDCARDKARDLYERRLVWESVPFRVLLEFNRRCNVKYVHCDIPREGTGELAVEVFERLLEEARGGIWEVMPLLGGEPTLAPIVEVAEVCRRHNVWLNFITNGVLFDRDYYERVADVTARIQFSLHAHTKERFERVVPAADFGVVVGNLADVVEIAARTEAHVVPCIVAMADILDDMEDYVRFVADLGCERLIIQKLYPHTRQLERLDPDRARDRKEVDAVWRRVLALARERGVFIETNVAQLFGDPENVPRRPSRFDILQDNAHIIEMFHPGFCCSTSNQLVVEWDGTMQPCIRDRIVLGNLNDQDFPSMWNGDTMRHLRRTFYDRALAPKCQACMHFYMEHA